MKITKITTDPPVREYYLNNNTIESFTSISINKIEITTASGEKFILYSSIENFIKTLEDN
ncbi:MAG TPA: hypothetical protein DC057_19660 [Spirochaetia bacterium]|nr:hypothetical protein [Spirochaetia bacterium]